MTPEGRYVRWFFATVALILVATSAWNVAVDPYSVFGTPLIDGFNANKPDFVEQLRMTHVYAVDRRKPRCLILGTSRAGRGLDPESPALRAFDCYNMAFPSASLYEIRRYLQHVKTARRIVLGLDFRTFGTRPDTTGAFAEKRLDIDADGHRQFTLFSGRLPDLASALLSLPALQSSIKTVRQQRWTNETLTPNGFWLRHNDRYDHRRAFVAYTQDSLSRFRDIGEDDAVFASSYRELRTLLRSAYASGLEVWLFISPSHAWHWQALEVSGMWPRFEAIKRKLVRLNAEEASRAGRPAFPVWDFSGPYGPNVERVPTSPSVKMHWYWEPVHYKRALGDVILDRMLSGVRSQEWPDFGVRLDPGNLEAHLARLRDLQRQYAAEHPDVVAQIRTMLKLAN